MGSSLDVQFQGDAPGLPSHRGRRSSVEILLLTTSVALQAYNFRNLSASNSSPIAATTNKNVTIRSVYEIGSSPGVGVDEGDFDCNGKF